MSASGNNPPTLPGCSVLPPMAPANVSDGPQVNKSDRGADGRANGKPSRRKTADRFATVNTFADFTMRELTRAEIAVWLLLWRDTRNGTARTSQADLARRSGVAVSTVKRAISRLEKRGLLTVVFRGDLWRGPSRYSVHSIPKNEDSREDRKATPPR